MLTGSHLRAQGFEMTEIDSDLLYRHNVMAQQHQQQQPPHLNGGPQALLQAQQHQQQQHQLQGMPNVKSEGNMDELLSMFLRVRKRRSDSAC